MIFGKQNMNGSIFRWFLAAAKMLIGITGFLILFAGLAPAQTQSWQDGVPLFENIAASGNVRIDSSIQLASFRGQFQELAGFRFILGGYDWKWPLDNAAIGQPASEDIDFYTSRDLNFYLVTDGDGHRIIEINPVGLDNVWEFYYQNPASDKYLKYPVAAYPFEEDLETKYLITDKLRHRVIKVNRRSKIIEWRYGDETPGDGANQLNNPADALRLPNSTRSLICDQGNNRVIIVEESNWSVVWQWGAGVGGTLKVPVDVEFVPQTNEVLITDQQNHRVILVDTLTKNITFQFGNTGTPGNGTTGLNNPTDADMLANGRIMICDSSNQRLIEVDRSGRIMWQFHRPLKGLKDADRLPDNRILIIADSAGIRSWPFRLGYSNQTMVSEIHELERNVIFDSVFLSTIFRPDTTAVRMQMRSAKQDEEISSMNWYGPTGTNDYYDAPVTRINPIHKGGLKYQFRVFLDTNDPLYTPELTNVRVTYHYFHEDSAGVILTQDIEAAPGVIVTNWDTLKIRTLLPTDPLLRDDVQIQLNILDATTSQAIYDPINLSPFVDRHAYRLSGSPAWKGEGVQSIRLKATLRTSHSAVTPVLRDWGVSWQTTQASSSEIHFVNSDFNPVSYYHVTNEANFNNFNSDLVHLRLIDENLSQTQESIRLTIHVKSAEPGELDSVTVDLSRQTSGEFQNRSGLKAIISSLFPDPGDKTLQVHDRDTLEVTYRDPQDPSDVSTARVLMISGTRAQIRVENLAGSPVDSVALNDSVFVRILEEYDQDVSLAQDTVWVEVNDARTNDFETLPLFEIRNQLGAFSSGEFLTTAGLRLVQNAAGIPGDLRLQTLPGNQIAVRYRDNFSPDPVESFVVKMQPDTLIFPFSGLYDFSIAPNPYYGDKHTRLRLRVICSISAMQLTRIEIFNIAGEKLREISGDAVFSNALAEDQVVFAEDWWDLVNDNGNPVSSGTYWVKFSANLLEGNNGTSQSVSVIRKLLIIR
jgi:hypothetical protein